MDNDQEVTEVKNNLKNYKKIDIGMAIIVAGALIAGSILISLSWFIPEKTEPNLGDPSLTAIKMAPVTEKDHFFGNLKSSIAIVEYSDTECPFCKEFHKTMHKVMEKYGDDVVWIYRIFPLDNIHPKSRHEAQAVLCANELKGNIDGFWKYIDKLFEITPSNNGLDENLLPQIAKDLGFDEIAFNTCLESDRYQKEIEKSFEEGQKVGFDGTPFSAILKDGKIVDVIRGAASSDVISAKIDVLLK
ncbi:MAG: DsbA family protein [Candidatus Nomurabacteria bacterium]|nr:DsbA family protein [Candidatus Nomurabacteria bacterium]